MTLATTNIDVSTPIPRILLVDDNPSIHEDIKKILQSQHDDPLASSEADLFGDAVNPQSSQRSAVQFELDSAFQGEQAVAMAEEAVRVDRPFSMAFVDVRMPAGWDGIETIEHLREVDPNIQIVICSAYSDYSWKSIHERLGANDWLMILRKPFDRAEIQQLACAMTEKWKLGIRASLNTEALEAMVRHHAQKIQDANKELAERNISLTEMNERLSQEVHARQLADERIRHIAFHDTLTDLPNRAFLMERLHDCIGRSKRQSNYRFAVLFADVDNFKLVNDSLGHRVGDQLLAQIALMMMNAMRTMQASIRPSLDTVARLGGDEFVVLLDDIADVENVVRVAQRIQQAVCIPLDVGQRQIAPSISIGAAISQNEYEDAVDIMRDADTALYHAKGEGKGRIALFDQAMRSEVLERADIANDLRLAIARHEFAVCYQPIVSLLTGKVHCLEALVRWQHPTRGLLPPDAFLPIAEKTGMMEAIGEQVLEEVTSQLADWRARFSHASNLAISVNLSAVQIVDTQILKEIDRCTELHGLEPSALKIELTETATMHNLKLSRAVVDALGSRGIEVYLDDFGTGYSSLSTLHKLPFAAIKVDKSFISNIETDVECETTIRAIVMIAENRKIKLIAEGIETFEQVEILRNLGCEFGQGYFFARPLPAHALDAQLESGAAYGVANDGALVVSP
jgi:diguanylate cyclase (GGDEF)-like protein